MIKQKTRCKVCEEWATLPFQELCDGCYDAWGVFRQKYLDDGGDEHTSYWLYEDFLEFVKKQRCMELWQT